MRYFGNIALARSLTDLVLIDEYRLYFRPVVLGRGKPFFAGRTVRTRSAIPITVFDPFLISAMLPRTSVLRERISQVFFPEMIRLIHGSSTIKPFILGFAATSPHPRSAARFMHFLILVSDRYAEKLEDSPLERALVPRGSLVVSWSHWATIFGLRLIKSLASEDVAEELTERLLPREVAHYGPGLAGADYDERG